MGWAGLNDLSGLQSIEIGPSCLVPGPGGAIMEVGQWLDLQKLHKGGSWWIWALD